MQPTQNSTVNSRKKMLTCFQTKNSNISKKWNICEKIEFRNSSRNRKEVKIEQDSRFPTSLNIKCQLTLFSRQRIEKGLQKYRTKVEQWFSKIRVRISRKAVKGERDSRSHKNSKIIYSTLISRQNLDEKVGKNV